MKEETRKIVVRKRVELGMTQEQVAEAIEVSPKTISNYESGRTVPNVNDFKKLCEVLGLEAKELI